MALSAWSDLRSTTTREPGVGGVADAPQPWLPGVQNERSRLGMNDSHDQQVVPVYRDPTVPAKSGRRTQNLVSITKPTVMAPYSRSRRFGNASGATQSVDNNTTPESCSSSSSGSSGSSGEDESDPSSGPAAAAEVRNTDLASSACVGHTHS